MCLEKDYFSQPYLRAMSYKQKALVGLSGSYMLRDGLEIKGLAPW